MCKKILREECADGNECCVFHYHGHRGQVVLSVDDKASAGALLPRFQLVHPRRPHGTVVIGPESVAGLVLLPGADEAVRLDKLRLVEGAIVDYPRLEAFEAERLLFARQPLAVGQISAAMLCRSVVAVIGLSGGGSQVFPHLTRAGVGTIIGVDPQRVDADNLHASPWFTRFHSRSRVVKTTAARFSVWLANRETRFHGLRRAVADPDAVNAIRGADVIVGCVNNLHARADLQEIASTYCIPYVDIGFRVSSSDRDGSDDVPRMTGLPGNLFISVPGGPCMWCSGFISQAKLDRETGGRGREYLQGLDGRAAFVSPFNTVLAGQAAAEVLQLLLGYAAGVDRTPYRRYDGLVGTLLECSVRRDPKCPHCAPASPQGRLFGRDDLTCGHHRPDAE